MTLAQAALLGTLPAVFMFIASLVGLGRQPPKELSGALQHFASGILLSAVAQELVPPMVAAKGLKENLAVIIGFSLGVLVMILLGVLLPEAEEGEADADLKDEHEMPAKKMSKLMRAETCRKMSGERKCSGDRKNSVEALAESLLPEKTEDHPPFPSALVTAVAIDGMMDGLLLGIASAASETAGTVLAISLAIEMSFLGLTLATSLANQPRSKSIAAVALSPMMIIVAASVGGFFAGQLAEAQACKIGLLSFGASALLFMVAEELLLEAHEDGGEHVWWVDVQLYVGFISSIYLSKALA